MTVTRLQRIATLAPAVLGVDGEWLAEAINARLSGEISSLDHALGIVTHGGASAVMQFRATHRDKILRKVIECFFADLPPAEQARQLAQRVAQFEQRLWPKLSGRTIAPAHIVGTVDELLFQAFKFGKVPTSAKQLGRILAGHSLPPLDVQSAR